MWNSNVSEISLEAETPHFTTTNVVIECVNSGFVFGSSQIQISARTPAVLTSVCGSSKSTETSVEIGTLSGNIC
jgi:hypothetical protein